MWAGDSASHSSTRFAERAGQAEQPACAEVGPVGQPFLEQRLGRATGSAVAFTLRSRPSKSRYLVSAR